MTDLEVCNRALSLLGEGTVAALTAGEALSDSRVGHCLTQLPFAKGEFLSLYDWGFARQQAELVAAATPPLNWAYAHTLPADFKRLTAVYAAEEAAAATGLWSQVKQFALGQGQIRSKFEFVAIEYINDCPFSAWPPGALTAISRLLAHYLAVPVTGQLKLAQMLLQTYEQRDRPDALYQDATQYASNENFDPEQQMADTRFIQERYAGLTSFYDEA